MALQKGHRSTRRQRDVNPLHAIGRTLSDHGRALGELKTLTNGLLAHVQREAERNRVYIGGELPMLPEKASEKSYPGENEARPSRPQTMAERPVREAENALLGCDRALGELGEVIVMLEERLGPICVDTPPPQGHSGTAPVPGVPSKPGNGSSSLVRGIDDFSRRVENYAFRLNMLRGRLEV